MEEVGFSGALQNSKKNVFDSIFRTYWPELYSSALKRVHDKAIAEDIVQEVFISLWERRGELEIRGPIHAYLLSSVKFKVIDYFRKAILQEKHREDLQRLMDSQQVVDALEFQEMDREISLAVQSLPEKMRRIFEMSRHEEKSIAEISEALNLSSQTVKNQLSTALKILRKHFAYLASLLVITFR